MEKTEFLTIYATFERPDIVTQTLPSIIEETKRTGSKLIVHDSSVKKRKEKWDYLQLLNKDNDFFLILSDNLSMAHARNLCLRLGEELYAPDYICMVEDDHGFKPELITSMIEAMKKYYGKIAPNNLKFGLFTGCGAHNYAKRLFLEDRHGYPAQDSKVGMLGGANSCFRCAPASHWNSVLKGYDTDEYLISHYQTREMNFRNYNKGFTTMIVDNGTKVFDVEGEGRGSTNQTERLWDADYTASDKRSVYLGKKLEAVKL
jgi:hypothetical protein